jgi:hypothetical protein
MLNAQCSMINDKCSMINDLNLDVKHQAQIKEMAGLRLQKTQKAQALLKRQWANDLKKRKVYQACIEGLQRLQTSEASVMETLQGIETIEESTLKAMQAQWDEVRHFLILLEVEANKVSEWAMMEQWLKIQENEALMRAWEEMMKG